MFITLTEREVNNILMEYVTNHYTRIKLSDENASVLFVKDGSSTRVDKVEIFINEQY